MKPRVIEALAALVLVLAAFGLALLILVVTYQAGSC